jgi:hypothetical protein
MDNGIDGPTVLRLPKPTFGIYSVLEARIESR